MCFMGGSLKALVATRRVQVATELKVSRAYMWWRQFLNAHAPLGAALITFALPSGALRTLAKPGLAITT
jgi:hypothetical protein